jgi:hypothetical protein
LSIRRLLIFDSNVVQVPSFPAAPDDPEIQPGYRPKQPQSFPFPDSRASPQKQLGAFAPRVPGARAMRHLNSKDTQKVAKPLRLDEYRTHQNSRELITNGILAKRVFAPRFDGQ